jgi:soluble lytic murein transglycosylase
VRIYEGLTAEKGAVTEDVLTRLGHAALAAGDRKKAAEAFVRAYYEFPLTDSATIAGAQLPALQDQVTRTGYKLDIGRAQLLFGARRYAEARTAFQELQRVVDGDDKELADLRVAECDFNLKQYAAARDELRPYLDRASRKAEARFFYLSSLRELGDHLQYIALTSALVSEFPDSSWSEEALNNLATHYILMSEDALATRTFRELHDKFPSGLRTERAAWKYGWAAYKTGDYPEAIRVFEAAAARFPRSDYRPLYLYWAARSHGKLDQAAQADARLQLVYTDYGNSYYGRLAARQLTRSGTPLTIPADVRLASQQSAPAPDLTPIPTDSLIRLLLANGLYDDALGELRYAKRAWGNSSRIDATIAWVYHEQGLLRPAISLMRRTYPQHLTGGGQELPAEIRQVIFPLSYWNSIRKQSALRGLDPYLVAALIGQESTFDPNITSSANAWGLMQILPTTGRRLAKSLGIRNFKTGLLTNPEVNLRLGTLYFSRLVEQFGGSYYALASYNAGESRIVRWKAERPGMEEDEFIDDIPFPETQNYVKRILGTAEDYRMLYGGAGTPGEPSVLPAKAKAASEDPAVVPATARVKSPVVKKPVAKQKKAPARPARKKHRR